MNKFLYYLIAPTKSPAIVQVTLFFMRIGIGALTVGHGLPKMLGGLAAWEVLGSAMIHLGVYSLPTFWGFAAACSECFGGLAFILGLGTRISSFFLTITMIVAFTMHWQKNDPFTKYSFALTMIVIFVCFLIIGGGKFSLDNYLTKNKHLY